MALPLMIETELDERSATEAANRAQRTFVEASREIGRSFTDNISDGARAGGQAIDRMATSAQGAYRRMGEATEDVARQERQLQTLRDQGAQGIEAQARSAEQAREREARAIRQATQALEQYEAAALNAASGVGDSFSGLGAMAGGAGQEFADGFSGGFAGSAALMRLGAAGGPIGIALTGVAAIGLSAGKLLADNIDMGLQSLSTKDLFATRMGVDASTMSTYGQAAGEAFTSGWGESVADNLSSVQFGVQSGIVDRGSSQLEIEKFIAQTETASQVMQEDAQAISRGIRGFLTTGLVGSYEEGLDLMVSATQNGLNLSNDFIDTMEEYGTKFRDVGLNGSEAIGLINQMWEGGARNVDVAADGLKEFAITVTDNSETTRQAFEALGFNADDMARRFAAGGPAAREAFGSILTELRNVTDEQERNQVGLALFKTKWEDMGQAVQAADLGTAATQMGDIAGATDRANDALSSHTSGWTTLGREVDVTFGKMREWMADTSLGQFFNQTLPSALMPHPSFLTPAPPTAPPDPSKLAPMLLPGVDPSTVAGPSTAPGLLPGTSPGLLSPDNMLAPFLGSLGLQATGVPDSGPQRQAPVPMPAPGAASSPADVTKPFVDPSRYQVAAPSMASTGLGDQGAFFDAQTREISARNTLEESRVRLLQLEEQGTADQLALMQARNQVVQNERSYTTALRELSEAQQGTFTDLQKSTESLSSGLGEIGAALDKDLGISKGLPGLADNLVRFVASLAMAPMMGQLAAVSAANPNQGSGLMGYLGSTGALGDQFRGGVASSGSGAAALQPGVAMPQVGGYTPKQLESGMVPNNVNLLSVLEQAFPGIEANADTGRSDKYGEHGSGQALDIMVGANKALGDQVNQFLLQNADALGLQYNIWQQSMRYPDGSVSGMEDRGSPTQNHMDHVHARVSPGPAASGSLSLPSQGGGSSQATGGGGSTGWWSSLPAAAPDSLSVGLPGTAAPGGGLAGSPQAYPMGQSPGLLSFGNQGALAGANAGTATGGGHAPMAVGGPGHQGIGSAAMGALEGAAGALDMVMPGAGAVASTGMKLANRAIGQMGKYAAIGIGGLMETFLPAGSEKAGKGWLPKLAGGVAGAGAALPNVAGAKAPPPPQAGQGGGQGGNTTNNTTNIDVQNTGATENFTAKEIALHQTAIAAPVGAP